MSSKGVIPAWGPSGPIPKALRNIIAPVTSTLKILGLYPFYDNTGIFNFSTAYIFTINTVYFTLTVLAIIQNFQFRIIAALSRVFSYIGVIISLLNLTASLSWAIRCRRLRLVWSRLLAEFDEGESCAHRTSGEWAAAILYPFALLLILVTSSASKSHFWGLIFVDLPYLSVASNSMDLLTQWSRSAHAVTAALLLRERFSRVNMLITRIRPSSHVLLSRDRRRKRKVVPKVFVTAASGEEDQGGGSRVVEDARRSHEFLACYIREASSAVGLSFLLDSCSLFLFVTSNIYYGIEFYGHIKETRTAEAIIYRAWYLLLRILPLIAVLLACDYACEEANLTRSAVSGSLAYPLNQQTANQLKLFSVQLLHWKAEFSACGVLTLDASLIHTMANNVITYLIIIVQFVSSVEDSSGHDILDDTFGEHETR